MSSKFSYSIDIYCDKDCLLLGYFITNGLGSSFSFKVGIDFSKDGIILSSLELRSFCYFTKCYVYISSIDL